jgi:hypothetical protein
MGQQVQIAENSTTVALRMVVFTASPPLVAIAYPNTKSTCYDVLKELYRAPSHTHSSHNATNRAHFQHLPIPTNINKQIQWSIYTPRPTYPSIPNPPTLTNLAPA